MSAAASDLEVHGDERETHGVRAAISNGLSALHKRHYGRGPAKVRTHLAGETVMVLLYDGLTPIERTLRDAGHDESVLSQRRDFQLTLQKQFELVVQEATGIDVVAFMSVNHLDPDVCAEIFLLAEPWNGPGSSADREARGSRDGGLARTER